MRRSSRHDEPVSSTLAPVLLGLLATAAVLVATLLGAWVLVATPLTGRQPKLRNRTKPDGRDK
jgi:hypothetical protein